MKYTTKYHDVTLEGKSFLITGVAGFIGSHIAQYLLENGASLVRGVDNMITGQRSNIEFLNQYKGFEFVEGDLSDFEVCNTVCQNIDIICHQAALGSVPRSIKLPHHSTLHNICGFVNLVTAARDAGIKRFVYASSSSVYGDEPNLPKVEHRIGKPLSPYAITKLADELFAHNFGAIYGMEFLGMRYFNVFGPRQSPEGVYAAVIPLFTNACLQGETSYINGDGEQTRDFTFVENVVQINVKAMLSTNPEALNQVYNVGCGENISVNQLYELIKTYTGSSAVCQHRDPRDGDIRNSLADVSKAINLLGYEPKIKLKEGLKITVESFMA